MKKMAYVSLIGIVVFLTMSSTAMAVTPQVAAGCGHTVGLKSDGTVVAVGDNFYGQLEVSDWTDIVQIVVGDEQTIGLKGDGTAVAVGYFDKGVLDVSTWTNIVEIDVGYSHAVGLKSDGTVVNAGNTDEDLDEVNVWTDIKQVAAGGEHTVGLKSDGTVVAVGDNLFGNLEISDWTDIVQIATNFGTTVGLKSNGTVVAVGDNFYGQLEVSDWTDIVQIVAINRNTVGLKSDGTVVAVGDNFYGQLEVSDWTDIVQIVAINRNTVGLKSDGTVVAVGDNSEGQLEVSNWSDIVQMAAGCGHIVGLKSDGTVAAVGPNYNEQCNVGDWHLFVDTEDRDQDGVSNFDEVNIYGTDPDNPDTDGDALPDGWEIYGYDHDKDGNIDVDLPVMGTNPIRKDIFVEIDWQKDNNHSHRPKEAAINLVVDSFNRQNISLHVDYGQDLGNCSENNWKCGGSEIDNNYFTLGAFEENDLLEFGWSDTDEIYNFREYNNIRNYHFDIKRKNIFHYCVFAHYLAKTGRSGITAKWSKDFIVTLGAFPDEFGKPVGTIANQAGTFMHELGHSLGIGPNGAPADTSNPNYLSIMNYMFQFGGLISNSRSKYGIFTYSWIELPPMNENKLNENNGINGGIYDVELEGYGTRYWIKKDPILNPCYHEQVDVSILDINEGIDWNLDGVLEPEVKSDISYGKTGCEKNESYNTLWGWNDWEHLDFEHGGIGLGAEKYDEHIEYSEMHEISAEDDKEITHVIQPKAYIAEITPDLVKLKWDKQLCIEEGGNLSCYNVYKKIINNDFLQIGSTTDSVFIDTNLSSCENFFYGIKAVDYWGNESELSNIVEVYLPDITLPSVNVLLPNAGDALQDGATFQAAASDNCGVEGIQFSILEPSGVELLSLTGYLNGAGIWEADFDSASLPDGYYVLVAKATDTTDNEGSSTTVPFSIRNWAVVEHLPATANSKAGRTMPVKFSLRIAASVDSAQPFVRNEDLNIKICDENGATVYRASVYGDQSTDYRINDEIYITNFKTFKQSQPYTVQIWRPNNFKVGEFTFLTTK